LVASTLACASATTASYSALVSAEAVDGKNKQEKAKNIASINLEVLLLICSLLVGSAQQDYYTTTLYLC
jgi:hypothetical protein